MLETTFSYSLEIVRGISRYAKEQGNWVLFLVDQGPIKKVPSWIRSWQGEGMIIRSAKSEVSEQLSQRQIPMVELLGEHGECPSEVLSDEHQLGQMAAKHFQERGFRHYAWFSFGQTWWSRGFRQEYIQAVKEWGDNVHVSPFSLRRAESVHAPNFRPDQEKVLVRWLHDLPKPVGVFCPRDVNAIFLLNLCQMEGIAVPDEVAVLGVGDNQILCESTTPTLSSIDPNGQQTGYQAARLLDEKMRGNPLPELPIWIPPAGVTTRQSTDAIAVEHPDFTQALRFIRENATRRISVQEVADHLCVSRRTLLRWFQEYLRRSPEEEMIRVRMERARLLLRETGLSIEKVGLQVGYPLVEHFIRAFREFHGKTPRQYRLQGEGFRERPGPEEPDFYVKRNINKSERSEP
ncbi:MAG: DNA-binding transcriptional regulator [Planctomycetia bacterium]|nr:DNA-binding transcriptional regulator [Planctomycetia bacterium]